MDTEAIRSELKKVRDEIRSLKSDFSKKKDEKENHFKQGEDFSKEIDALYNEVKELEAQHGLDKINEDLEERKKEHVELKAKVDEFEKKFNDVKRSSKRTPKPEVKTVSLAKAEAEIKQLETKLQTSVLSLDKEGEVTRRVEELREIIDRHKGVSSGSSKEFKDVKKELNGARRKFINCEKKIRSLYKQIRLISKEKKKKYKLIDDLRDSKKKAFDEFKSHKKSYGDIGKTLKDLFKQEEELLEQLGESPKQKKKAFDTNIKAKQKEVTEKLMEKGGTLTTEDLLMLQRGK